MRLFPEVVRRARGRRAGRAIALGLVCLGVGFASGLRLGTIEGHPLPAAVSPPCSAAPVRLTISRSAPPTEIRMRPNLCPRKVIVTVE